ncbi:hypothetical protein [Escherichia coli]|uniref:hypothetical protein n=1 Tax=Escherichia coli TaxID=562 RepID=UPI0039A1B49A
MSAPFIIRVMVNTQMCLDFGGKKGQSGDECAILGSRKVSPVMSAPSSIGAFNGAIIAASPQSFPLPLRSLAL